MTILQLLGIAVLLIFLFFLGNLAAIGGYKKFSDVPQDVVTSTAMMVMFILMMICCAHPQGLLSLFQTLCNGIPGVSVIMDFGSLSEMWHQAPERGVEMFLDTMLVSFFMNLVGALFVLWDQNQKDIKNLFSTVTRVFLSLVAAVFITLVVVNIFIKATGVYKLVVNIVSGLIAAFTLPSLLNPILKVTLRQKIDGMIFFATLVALWDSWIVKKFRQAFMDALVYCIAAFAIEKIFGSIQGLVSLGTSLLAAFAPCVVMIFGIWMMLGAGLGRKKR